jgi:mono/diheme cytochrome c family protein
LAGRNFSLRKEAAMKGWVACGFIVASVAFAAQAQVMKTTITSEADYSKYMKEVASINGGLRGAGAAPTDDNVKAAQRLGVIFKDVQAYWEDKKVDDAIGFSKAAVAGADTLAKALTAKDEAAVGAAQKALAGQCAGCHMAHREKTPEGTFKMK